MSTFPKNASSQVYITSDSLPDNETLFIAQTFDYEQYMQELQKSTKEKIRQGAEKDVRILPDSGLYFLKRFWEGLRGLVVFGNNKTEYLVNLSQKRLKESFLLAEAKKLELAEECLGDYIKLSERLKKRNLIESEEVLNQNYIILQAINFSLRDGQGEIVEKINRSFVLTSFLLTQISEQKIRKETKEWIEGKVIENYPVEIIMEWESKKIYISGLEKAQYVDKSGEITNQSYLDIKKDSIVAVAPLDKIIKYSQKENFDGEAIAEKIIIGGRQ